MLIKQLEYLAALARERHFARAAAACGVTQPTLSAGIKQLEETVGVLIVQRGQRFRGLTPEGERVLSWARRVLGDYESLTQELSALGHGLVGRLRMGAIPTMLPLISLLTTPFAAQHPRVTLTVLSLTSAEIQRGLDAFELEAGLTYLDNEPPSRVRTLPLYRERYLLLTPVEGPCGGRDTVTWREAAALPLCLLTPDMQNRRIVDAQFRAAGITAQPAIETNSLITVCSHLRTKRWSTVLPHTALYLVAEFPGLRAIPLVEPGAEQAVGLIVPERDPLPPAAQALLAVAGTLDLAGALEREIAPAPPRARRARAR